MSVIFSLGCMFDITILLVPVLVCVAFLTLFERNVLGYMQARNGPNNVSVSGLLQPFSDAVNLFINEFFIPYQSSWSYLLSPGLILLLMLLIWSLVPCPGISNKGGYSVLVLIAVLSLNVYPLFFSGWASNSKYGMIGGVRGVAQAISYEISLALIFLSLMVLNVSISLDESSNHGIGSLGILLSPLLIVWLISCVAETNRSPFDFSEGESELVSGFNIEFGSVLFTLMFLSEYGIILLLSLLSSWLFLVSSWFLTVITSSGFLLVWVWLRGSFPRFRYDKLMSLGWNTILPISVCFLGSVVGLEGII